MKFPSIVRIKYNMSLSNIGQDRTRQGHFINKGHNTQIHNFHNTFIEQNIHICKIDLGQQNNDLVKLFCFFLHFIVDVTFLIQ